MSTSLTRPTSRSNSTRSRKHSAPVQIHALLGTTGIDGTGRKHGQGHRRGASLSASATVSPTPVDRPPMANKSRSDVSNKTNNDTHFASPSSSSSPLQQMRQRSHSYASAPLSTLLTRLESPSLASFTLADPHPCAAGSLRRCQWMMEMNASGHWYAGDDGVDDDDESTDDHHHHYVQHNKNNVDNKKTTLPTTSSPLAPKRKRMLALPLRLWKKNNISFVNHKWDSESDSHADVEDDDGGGGTYCEESDSDGADDTPSLTPHSSRRSSRSRSSADDRSPISISSSSPPLPPSGSRANIPPVSRRHSDESSSSPLVARLAGAKPAPSTLAVRHNGDAKVAPSMTKKTGSSSGKKVFKQDPGTALQQYKEAPITATIPPKPSSSSSNVQTNMQTESVPSSSSRTLRSSKNRRISSTPLLPNTNTNDMRIPFPVNPSLSPPTSPRSPPPTSNPPVLLTLSDLERTSKLMRSTTTCAVCGRSGSDFPRCPRTGAAWCSRACRIAAKKNASS